MNNRTCGQSRLVAVGVLVAAQCALAQWPGWGGKNRDFVVDAKGLATTWPKNGPRKLWSRPLGPGHSSISAVDGRLFTMYREGEHDVVVAIDAHTGKTVWEYRYVAPAPEHMNDDGAVAPNATPLVHEGKVYTLGIGGKLLCLDDQSGNLIWSHDLVADFNAKVPAYGFSSSPLVAHGRLIVSVGGPGVGMMAFDLATGAVLWKKHDFEDVYSSPIAISVHGEDEVVQLVGAEVVGLDPSNGEIKWRHSFGTSYGSSIMTPLYGGNAVLYLCAGGASHGLKLSRQFGWVSVEELWSTAKLQLGYHNAVRSGEVVYAVHGGNGAFFMTALDVRTGQVLWRERGFVSGNVIYADGKLITLEEDGHLSISTATPEKLELKSRFQLFGPVEDEVGPVRPTHIAQKVWSTPTLVGDRLYVRDDQVLVALDLSKAGNP